MNLTVAIPSFDRNEELNECLEHLLPQLDERCLLLILDNCSPRPVAETTASLLAEYPHVRVNIVRNAVNIGANANIARCFELCESEHLWVLSDDDWPLPNALVRIEAAVTAHPEAFFINFSSEVCGLKAQRLREVVTLGQLQFAERMDSFSKVLFISAGIFRMTPLRANMRFAYHYSYTMAAPVALLLSSLGSEGECVYSSQRIVRWRKPDENNTWPPLNQWLGCMCLLELPMPQAVRKQLSRRIASATVKLERVVLQIAATQVETGEYREFRWLYLQAVARLCKGHSFLWHCRARLYGLALLAPGLMLGLGRALLRVVSPRKLSHLKSICSSERL